MLLLYPTYVSVFFFCAYEFHDSRSACYRGATPDRALGRHDMRCNATDFASFVDLYPRPMWSSYWIWQQLRRAR